MFDNDYALKLRYGSMYSMFSGTLDAIAKVDETLGDIPWNDKFGDHFKEINEMAVGLVETIWDLETWIRARDREIDALNERINQLQKEEP